MVLEKDNALPGCFGGEVSVLLGTDHGHVDVGKGGVFGRIKPVDVIRLIRILSVFVRGRVHSEAESNSKHARQSAVNIGLRQQAVSDDRRDGLVIGSAVNVVSRGDAFGNSR
jgi:hypothetical protein